MKNQNKILQIYLMCYNRPEYILEALESILAQDYQHFEIVISDNSTNQGISELLEKYKTHPLITYIRRTPSLGVLDHHNQIVSEVTAPYFMMFHDDDIMMPKALTRLMNGIVDSSFVAVGANAYLLRDHLKTSQKFNPYLKSTLAINSPESLAQHHLKAESGHVPFPSYLYKTSVSQKVRFNFKEGRRYGDVTYLLKLSHLGPILWLDDCIMYYRKHSSSGSASVDIRAVFSLCRFVSSTTRISKHLIEEYKMKSYFLWARKPWSIESDSLSLCKYEIIKTSAFIYLLKNPNIFVKSIAKKFLSLTRKTICSR